MTLCVLLCRDCCCGTERKHPEVDHAGQEAALRAAAADGGGKVIRTRCLGICERSNVVVAKTPAGTYWFEGVLTAENTRAVCAFVRARGGMRAPSELLFQVGAARPVSAE